MLKKQTVWLLTMVSLMIVLSVYYMMPNRQNVAYMNTDNLNEVDKEVTTPGETEDPIEIDSIQNLHSSQMFTTIRMEVQDKRNLKKDRLKDVVKSSDATVNEINDALNEIDYLEKVTMKETILQETILSTDKAYEDVLVRTEEDQVHVHVITDDLSREAAAHIMQMVMDEFGNIEVSVNFQPIVQ